MRRVRHGNIFFVQLPPVGQNIIIFAPFLRCRINRRKCVFEFTHTAVPFMFALGEVDMFRQSRNSIYSGKSEFDICSLCSHSIWICAVCICNSSRLQMVKRLSFRRISSLGYFLFVDFFFCGCNRCD